jgi:hypothetical protein
LVPSALVPSVAGCSSSTRAAHYRMVSGKGFGLIHSVVTIIYRRIADLAALQAAPLADTAFHAD